MFESHLAWGKLFVTDHVLKAFAFIGNNMRHVVYDDFTLVPAIGYFSQTYVAVTEIGYVYTVNEE